MADANNLSNYDFTDVDSVIINVEVRVIHAKQDAFRPCGNRQ